MHYHLSDGWHHRIIIHSKFGGKLVSDSGEASFCSTGIIYRINLDRALHPNGHLTLIWKETPNSLAARIALNFFAAQLIVNVLWSVAFFSMRSPKSGVVVIAFLWVLILINIIKFWPINRTAALLLILYISWVSFAAYLNYSIWRLNA